MIFQTLVTKAKGGLEIDPPEDYDDVDFKSQYKLY